MTPQAKRPRAKKRAQRPPSARQLEALARGRAIMDEIRTRGKAPISGAAAASLEAEPPPPSAPPAAGELERLSYPPPAPPPGAERTTPTAPLEGGQEVASGTALHHDDGTPDPSPCSGPTADPESAPEPQPPLDRGGFVSGLVDAFRTPV